MALVSAYYRRDKMGKEVFFVCPNCGAQIVAKQTGLFSKKIVFPGYCGNCSTKIITTCPKCSYVQTRITKYCENCNTQLYKGNQEKTVKKVDREIISKIQDDFSSLSVFYGQLMKTVFLYSPLRIKYQSFTDSLEELNNDNTEKTEIPQIIANAINSLEFNNLSEQLTTYSQIIYLFTTLPFDKIESFLSTYFSDKVSNYPSIEALKDKFEKKIRNLFEGKKDILETIVSEYNILVNGFERLAKICNRSSWWDFFCDLTGTILFGPLALIGTSIWEELRDANDKDYVSTYLTALRSFMNSIESFCTETENLYTKIINDSMDEYDSMNIQIIKDLSDLNSENYNQNKIRSDLLKINRCPDGAEQYYECTLKRIEDSFPSATYKKIKELMAI